VLKNRIKLYLKHQKPIRKNGLVFFGFWLGLGVGEILGTGEI